jgi:transposase
MAHRRGESRQQAALFPVMLDELVAPDALVRVIDAWIGALALADLGFAKSIPQRLGAPPYDPADLLRLYLWGYLNAVRSSRALERECHRNVECMWLLGRLAPDHKTIAEFRRGNLQALVAASAAFVQFARSQRLIASTTVAIDGSKVQAVASRKAIVGPRSLAEQAQRNAQDIERYLSLLEDADRQEASTCGQGVRVRKVLERLQIDGQRIADQAKALAASGKRLHVSTEPDAQVMRSLNSAPGYNLQTAVEAGSHLIVAHEVCADANDQTQLQPMAEAASNVLQAPCTVVADAGYANGTQIAALQAQGMQCYLPAKRSVNNQGDGQHYDRSAFTYEAEHDHFVCPAGQLLERKQITRKDCAVIYAARIEDCSGCAQKPQCTQAARRLISRHLFEDALHTTAQGLKARPEMMALRRQTVEHPFACIKHRILGNARLLLRGLPGAKGELSLAVLAYNFKRVFNIKGSAWMHLALQG